MATSSSTRVLGPRQAKLRRTSENVTRVEDVLLPIPLCNSPSVDIDTGHMKNEEKEEEDHEFPSFRHFVIINKESENNQISDPEDEDEEFSFWQVQKESDEIFLQDSKENSSAAEVTWLPIPSPKNTTVNKDKEEEEEYSGSEDDEECFECLQVQIDIANRRKQFSRKEEEEDGEESTDEENVEDEFSLLQKDILQGRIKFDSRRCTSRSILSCSSSQQQKKKVRFNLVEDCCPVSDRFRKAEILFSKISRVLRFRNRSLNNAGISLKTLFEQEVCTKDIVCSSLKSK